MPLPVNRKLCPPESPAHSAARPHRLTAPGARRSHAPAILHSVPLSLLAFAVSLLVLIVAARFFTHGAERVGLALGMSPFAIGVLIVSVGTSLPELVASIVAASRGSSAIVVGNVLGANLSNLLLVMGAAAVAARASIRLGDQYILIDLNFLLGSALLAGLVLRDGTVGRVEGGALLAAYSISVIYLMREG